MTPPVGGESWSPLRSESWSRSAYRPLSPPTYASGSRRLAGCAPASRPLLAPTHASGSRRRWRVSGNRAEPLPLKVGIEGERLSYLKLPDEFEARPIHQRDIAAASQMRGKRLPVQQLVHEED